jgi:anti-sigma regulatory factor (Ser/Thr protein kinase)
MNEPSELSHPLPDGRAGERASGAAERAAIAVVRRGDFSALPDAVSWFAASAEALHLPDTIRSELDFCLSELLANIASYAFDDDATHDVRLQLIRSEGRVLLVLEDEGRAFDPVSDVEYIEAQTLEQAGHRGYGVHLVRRLSDAIHYRRDDGRNILTVEKRLPE